MTDKATKWKVDVIKGQEKITCINSDWTELMHNQDVAISKVMDTSEFVWAFSAFVENTLWDFLLKTMREKGKYLVYSTLRTDLDSMMKLMFIPSYSREWELIWAEVWHKLLQTPQIQSICCYVHTSTHLAKIRGSYQWAKKPSVCSLEQ